MSSTSPPPNFPEGDNREGESNGGAVQNAPEETKRKRGIFDFRSFKQESVIALCVGFVFLSFVFSYFGWFEGILEKAHVSSWIIFGAVFIIFVIGLTCVAWVIVEWLGHPKLVTALCCGLSIYFLVFLCSHKGIYAEENPSPEPQPIPQPTQKLAPTVSPENPPLYNNIYFNQNDVTIYNPLDEAVFNVMLKIAIEGKNVPPDSLNIGMDDPDIMAPNTNAPISERIYTGYTTRLNYLNDPSRQFCFFTISSLGPHAIRKLHLVGTLPVESEASISVFDYTNIGYLGQTKSNYADVQSYPGTPLNLITLHYTSQNWSKVKVPLLGNLVSEGVDGNHIWYFQTFNLDFFTNNPN